VNFFRAASCLGLQKYFRRLDTLARLTPASLDNNDSGWWGTMMKFSELFLQSETRSCPENENN
jgi:hypothetical protein